MKIRKNVQVKGYNRNIADSSRLNQTRLEFDYSEESSKFAKTHYEMHFQSLSLLQYFVILRGPKKFIWLFKGHGRT